MDKEQAKPVHQAELADALKVRPSTVKYYTNLGLLPYEVLGKGKNRLYDIEACKLAFKEITKLKKKGYKMTDIVRLYAEQGKLAGGVDLQLLNLTKIRG
jgi:DNA-binding transcriptional MerR regulator